MLNPRFLTLTAMVVTVAIARLMPHPPNVTPIAAMALFAGAHFHDKRQAFLIPIAALLVSDLVLGFYPLWAVVYIAHIAVVGIGILLQRRPGVLPVAAATVGGSLTFFLISNIASFFTTGLYPLSLAGLAQCYTAALPFFRNSLLGDAFYTALMFSAFYLAKQRFSVLAVPSHGFAR